MFHQRHGRGEGRSGASSPARPSAWGSRCPAATYRDGSRGNGRRPHPADKARYTTTDTGGATVPDPAGYANALFSEVTDLNTTLSASEADKLAAAFRLLDINLAPIGTGPYKLTSYKPGESIELTRNDAYFQYKPGAPQILIPIIKDADAAADALVSGNIDFDNTIISSDALAKLKADPNVKLSEFPDLGYYYFAFNVRPGHVFADRAAQDAVKMCIDPSRPSRRDRQQRRARQVVRAAGLVLLRPDAARLQVRRRRGQEAPRRRRLHLGADGVYAKGTVKLQADLRVRQGRPAAPQVRRAGRDQLKDCGISLNVLETDSASC